MAYTLNSVVPWGRTLDEYENMFALTQADLQKKIISFGDGPASFNAEMTAIGNTVLSIDPIYQFTAGQLRQRIDETCIEVINQTTANQENFVWDTIKSVEELKEKRMGAMERFLADFEEGKHQKRYLTHSLPAPTSFLDDEFDLGLSSHFLLLYSNLGLDFHQQSINEMMRICKEVRIFPLVNLNAEKNEFIDSFLIALQSDYFTEIVKVAYEFQRGGNQMLVIKKR
ncbi:hypothetical protein C8P68_103432 [Mucilaginibacter yixingensis]|uniref:SAM-dependent methyltransferase n=1 Tax=Mucilaginibacter yixingensis TaxID=1295612 RepID=A0A2T5JBM6_9SPHI|nr:SAM-dependent methyltransferase [Mucilaginibacter yixingensis]PTQ98271.1 hypothetical protein C8P68_103432 [Mucilaginibacter yixingensis]